MASEFLRLLCLGLTVSEKRRLMARSSSGACLIIFGAYGNGSSCDSIAKCPRSGGARQLRKDEGERVGVTAFNSIKGRSPFVESNQKTGNRYSIRSRRRRIV